MSNLNYETNIFLTTIYNDVELYNYWKVRKHELYIKYKHYEKTLIEFEKELKSFLISNNPIEYLNNVPCKVSFYYTFLINSINNVNCYEIAKILLSEE